MSAPLTLFVTLASDDRAAHDEIDVRNLLRARGLDDLRRELQEIERRLGTPAEQAGDFEWVRALAHELNNRATMEYLRAAIAGENQIIRLVA